MPIAITEKLTAKQVLCQKLDERLQKAEEAVQELAVFQEALSRLSDTLPGYRNPTLHLHSGASVWVLPAPGMHECKSHAAAIAPPTLLTPKIALYQKLQLPECFAQLFQVTKPQSTLFYTAISLEESSAEPPTVAHVISALETIRDAAKVAYDSVLEELSQLRCARLTVESVKSSSVVVDVSVTRVNTGRSLSEREAFLCFDDKTYILPTQITEPVYQLICKLSVIPRAEVEQTLPIAELRRFEDSFGVDLRLSSTAYQADRKTSVSLSAVELSENITELVRAIAEKYQGLTSDTFVQKIATDPETQAICGVLLENLSLVKKDLSTREITTELLKFYAPSLKNLIDSEALQTLDEVRNLQRASSYRQNKFQL